jgi:glycosyltransferase involved in cell wall biosynthesis
MQVAVNCAIANRGISGSSRGLSHILYALDQIPEVALLETWPRHGLRQRRIWNAASQASWDLYLAAQKAQSADVLISPCNVGRALHDQRHVLVLHDTMVLDRPDLFNPGYALYAKALFGFSLRSADVILVPSRFTARCLMARWPDAPQIIVAPWPLRTVDFRPRETAGPKHVLMIGATEPHKRQLIGIEAVKMARERSGEELLLTVLGPRGRSEREVLAALRTADPDQRWTTRRVNVPQTELELIYQEAWVLLQPSQMEGYGLPVGEAASMGIPVIHSGLGALNEIVPTTVALPDDPVSYTTEICELLDHKRYSTAVSAALGGAGSLSITRFTQAVAKAVVPDLVLS